MQASLHKIRRTLLVGVGALGGGVALVALPFCLGRGDANKYLVVVGVILTCWGISCLILGAIDWLRGK